jgi:hypothetical protein
MTWILNLVVWLRRPELEVSRHWDWSSPVLSWRTNSSASLVPIFGCRTVAFRDAIRSLKRTRRMKNPPRQNLIFMVPVWCRFIRVASQNPLCLASECRVDFLSSADRKSAEDICENPPKSRVSWCRLWCRLVPEFGAIWCDSLRT